MLELIRDRLAETGAEPGDIVLELSEDQLAAAAKTRSEFVHAVAEIGCQVALDAFKKGGRGSFLLKQFPIGYIKLGPPFVEDLAVDRERRRSVSDTVQKNPLVFLFPPLLHPDNARPEHRIHLKVSPSSMPQGWITRSSCNPE